MTQPGDGDAPDEGRRKRRGRRRGRRSKRKAPGATGVTETDVSGAPSDAPTSPSVRRGESSENVAANTPAASGKRKSRSRRRKSGARAGAAHAKPSSDTARPSGPPPQPPLQPPPHPHSRRAGDVPAPLTASTSHAAASSSAAPNTAPDAAPNAAPGAAPNATPGGKLSDADALAARRARADRETSAGGIVYRVQNGEALFLIIRDSYRNWGFPKGHLEGEELPNEAAIREVQEETGLVELQLDGAIETIDWFFRFRGRLVHKVCHFYLMRTDNSRTVPQREEGITACRWARFEEATRLISYANARSVLSRANAMVLAGSGELAEAGPRAGVNVNAHPHANTKAADAARG